MPQTIDAHHHLWHFTPEEFDWLEGPLAPLRRDFLPAELASTLAAAGVDGCVTVQARQSLEETRWLLQLASKTPEIKGVVGWVPLIDPNLDGILEAFTPNTNLKGLRHVLQAEPDPDYILRADFNAGIRALTRRNLVYDILIFERHLPQTIQFVDRHPDQIFVLDHIAKPRIADGALEPWATNIRALAQRANVFCKLSGMVTEASPDWTPARLTPYLDTVVEAFTSVRLLAASDWPVLLPACAYADWFGLLRDFFAAYSPTEQAAIFGQTATDVYRL
jgi:L-fuconolactonase